VSAAKKYFFQKLRKKVTTTVQQKKMQAKTEIKEEVDDDGSMNCCLSPPGSTPTFVTILHSPRSRIDAVFMYNHYELEALCEPSSDGPITLDSFVTASTGILDTLRKQLLIIMGSQSSLSEDIFATLETYIDDNKMWRIAGSRRGNLPRSVLDTEYDTTTQYLKSLWHTIIQQHKSCALDMACQRYNNKMAAWMSSPGLLVANINDDHEFEREFAIESAHMKIFSQHLAELKVLSDSRGVGVDKVKELVMQVLSNNLDEATTAFNEAMKYLVLVTESDTITEEQRQMKHALHDPSTREQKHDVAVHKERVFVSGFDPKSGVDRDYLKQVMQDRFGHVDRIIVWQNSKGYPVATIVFEKVSSAEKALKYHRLHFDGSYLTMSPYHKNHTNKSSVQRNQAPTVTTTTTTTTPQTVTWSPPQLQLTSTPQPQLQYFNTVISPPPSQSFMNWMDPQFLSSPLTTAYSMVPSMASPFFVNADYLVPGHY
jgi:hypothetical protein